MLRDMICMCLRMKKSIKKFNPIILVEYNTENFKEIYKF